MVSGDGVGRPLAALTISLVEGSANEIDRLPAQVSPRLGSPGRLKVSSEVVEHALDGVQRHGDTVVTKGFGHAFGLQALGPASQQTGA